MKPMLTAVTFACTTGCAPPQTIPLTQEQQKIIDERVAQLRRGQEFHEALAYASRSSTVYDAKGATGADPYLFELDSAVDLVEQINEKGRIVGFHGGEETDVDRTHAQAMYFEDAEGPCIAINLDVENAINGISPSVLLHEGLPHLAGEQSGHDPEIRDAVLTPNHDYETQAFARLVLEHKDLPYLGSLLQEPVDWLTLSVDVVGSLEGYVKASERMGQTSEEIIESLEDFEIAQSQPDWAMSQGTDLFEVHQEYLTLYGVTESDIQEALKLDTQLYAPAHEAVMEWIAQYRENQTEAHESQNERRRFR